jgi:hypothetical protein
MFVVSLPSELISLVLTGAELELLAGAAVQAEVLNNTDNNKIINIRFIYIHLRHLIYPDGNCF